MAKLSENQEKCVTELKALLESSGAKWATRSQWKKALPKGVTLVTEGLVKAGAVLETKACIREGEPTEIYALAVPTF